MKKWFILSLAAVWLAGTVGAQQPDIFDATRGSVVFVNLERAFNEFYKTQLAKSKIELQKKDIEAEKQVLIDEMTGIDEDVNDLKKEARDITLAEEIRDSKRLLYEERLLDLREKQKEIEAFQAMRQQQIQLQVTRMSQKIMDEIRQTIIEYAKENGLMAVLDNSARKAAVSVFIYTHPDVDITEDILNTLNRRRPDVLDDDGLFSKETALEAPPGEPAGE